MSLKWPSERAPSKVAKIKRNYEDNFGQVRPEKKEEAGTLLLASPTPLPELTSVPPGPADDGPAAPTPGAQRRVSPLSFTNPPVPPKIGAEPTIRLGGEVASPAQSVSASLEFIRSNPTIESRDPSGGQDRGRAAPEPKQEKGGWRRPVQKSKKASAEHLRSDSQGRATFYRSSSSPVSGQPPQTQTNIINPASDEHERPLPAPPASFDSRNEAQPSGLVRNDQESASILDELMKRYERKEVEMRKTHEKEMRRLLKSHALELSKWEGGLVETKASHAKEVQELKEQQSLMEMNCQDLRRGMIYYQNVAEESQRAVTEQAAELQREHQEKVSLVGELNSKYEAMEKKTQSQIGQLEEEVKNLTGVYENKLKDLKDHYEYKLREQVDRHQGTAHALQKKNDDEVGEMRKQIAELTARLTAMTDKAEASRLRESSFQKEAQTLRRHCDDLQTRYADQLEGYAAHEKSMLKKMEDVREYYEGRLKSARAKADDQRAQLEERLEHQQVALAHEMEMREVRFRNEMEAVRANHQQTFAAATRDLNQRIRSLESDLIDNGDDMKPTLGGGALQTRYRELKLKVEKVTEPFNLAELRSAHGFETAHLDRCGFLEREGKGQLRFLLRSICWSIILDSFFSSPFGFGAFGRGEGREMLLAVYATWQRLFDPGFTGFIAAPELSDQEDFEPFYNNKVANWWRSATFQSIQSAVFPSRRVSQSGKPGEGLAEENDPSRGPQGIVKAFADNVEKAKRGVLDVITKVCGVEKANEAIESEVDDMVRCASVLAVEFGVHGSKICFGMPKSGDTVRIGPEFVDCEDGDSNRGNLEKVDLAITPSLFMIGDGRRDLTTATCLHPGEIYPRRGEEK